MEWTNIHIRHAEYQHGDLKDGDVCVVRLNDDENYNYTGIVLAIFFEGEFYDCWIKEDPSIPAEMYYLTNYYGDCIARDYFNTGENVENISSPAKL